MLCTLDELWKICSLIQGALKVSQVCSNTIFYVPVYNERHLKILKEENEPNALMQMSFAAEGDVSNETDLIYWP